eukprot:9044915-Pyramimonas_sp.AAC.1
MGATSAQLTLVKACLAIVVLSESFGQVVVFQDFAFGDDHREGTHQLRQLGWNALVHPSRTTDKGGL